MASAASSAPMTVAADFRNARQQSSHQRYFGHSLEPQFAHERLAISTLAIRRARGSRATQGGRVPISARTLLR